ncbi:MAG: hypothetical protein HYT43_00375 [Candidatus Taylorbacteria bacterium]|nr:hypothetical protein [Candidatus Taylorbacteria bacterium]
MKNSFAVRAVGGVILFFLAFLTPALAAVAGVALIFTFPFYFESAVVALILDNLFGVEPFGFSLPPLVLTFLAVLLVWTAHFLKRRLFWAR